MKEITKEKFYNSVGNMNATIAVVGDYPYTVEYRMRNTRILVGKVVDEYTDGIKNRYPIIHKYYANI